MSQEYRAPWGASLKIVTCAACALCLGISGWAAIAISTRAGSVAYWIGLIGPLLLLLGAAPFAVRGYRVGDGVLEIERLGWSTRFTLASLESAEAADRRILAHSLRLFGNGGLFVFAGWFWNRRLGRYRAFGTNLKNIVVLKFRERTLVVTPESPERFVAAVLQHHPRAARG